MPMCDGKIIVTKDFIVKDKPFQIHVHKDFKFIDESRNLEYGKNSQSLTDIILTKLLEGILGLAPIENYGKNTRIEYTDENEFWITISKDDNGDYLIGVYEPAA